MHNQRRSKALINGRYVANVCVNSTFTVKHFPGYVSNQAEFSKHQVMSCSISLTVTVVDPLASNPTSHEYTVVSPNTIRSLGARDPCWTDGGTPQGTLSHIGAEPATMAEQ